MSGLLFPKETRRKRKKHRESILQKKDGTCYICAHKYGNLYRYRNLQEHHIFGGPNRQLSEEEGLKVYLCISHHIIGPEAVHNNIENMRYLQREGQQVFEKTHTRQEFIEKFGRNYLD